MTTAALRIVGARLIDGTGALPVDDGVIHIDEDGTLAYAGRAAGEPGTAPGVRTVDLRGRTVLPGFIDTHVHFGAGSPADVARRFQEDPTLRVFRTAERMRKTLDAGVTTARDLGGIPAGFRTAQAEGLTAGPRLHTAVRIMGHTGGHADFSTPCGLDLSDGIGEIVDTPDQVRIGVRRLLREGADVIKLCATGGMGSPHDQPDDEGLSEEEIRTVVDEVSRHGGRPVAAHAQGTAGILNAVRGGVTSVEHGYGLDARARELAGERGTFVVPTLSTVFDGIDKSTMEPYHYEKKIRWSGITKENIAAAIADGVRIAMGTDAAMCPHGRNLRELTHLVALGMSPLAAITAGTSSAAELLGLSERIGTLTAGKDADLVVCDGDPLADISLLADPARVVAVLQRGTVRKSLLPDELPADVLPAGAPSAVPGPPSPAPGE
ncbi:MULTISPECIES: amidohydrolase family protein [unclassified Streptomyces]|uniref:metal-dependent hydrolase family protein n=1 Tax=unclassified Streptomyces TaxID=2593676 RepID=UPI002DD7C648|nr:MULTISPECIES: amidohydrolase family protein [unclassified Streptomyces]WSA95297.1 amidohydrolase family protein [Streptomyces sp. NBC_01795]WSB79715.1 amidohydrolase family protein [Streptomyces sp. NBC_01775]WSS12079.1 amidohydrolase family protein [Streptomyces sp. NBC_01186]WSS40792.1 amidohydrolase family protein [Streptomyces sp. NBC_01187]